MWAQTWRAGQDGVREREAEGEKVLRDTNEMRDTNDGRGGGRLCGRVFWLDLPQSHKHTTICRFNQNGQEQRTEA